MTLHALSNVATAPSTGEVLIGASPAVAQLKLDIEAAARSDAKVLIVGETGVGKEVVARLVHNGGRRRMRSFLAINCASLPDSLLESELFGHSRGSFTGAHRDRPGLMTLADRGTLFLDELGEMSLRMQAILLRFLETGEIQRVGGDRLEARVDVRIIAATNRKLLEQIQGGEFREDLYYRVNVIRLTVPPLRERGADVLMLLDHFLEYFAQEHHVEPPTFTPAARDMLAAYSWPGNVRELKNIVERLVVRHGAATVGPDSLPSEVLDHTFRPSRFESALEPATSQSAADVAWERIVVGRESFWNAAYATFADRELTKTDLRRLIKAGLQRTEGSYRKLLELFNMPPKDYKRFLAFLYQHDCHIPFHLFRGTRAGSEHTSQAKRHGVTAN